MGSRPESRTFTAPWADLPQAGFVSASVHFPAPTPQPPSFLNCPLSLVPVGFSPVPCGRSRAHHTVLRGGSQTKHSTRHGGDADECLSKDSVAILRLCGPSYKCPIETQRIVLGKTELTAGNDFLKRMNLWVEFKSSSNQGWGETLGGNGGYTVWSP